MSNPYFQFKKFTVWHDQCAMKVGTDGVLLGAWSKPGDARYILDIGTGTGLIALMLAQKSTSPVDAIDIDKDAIQQAQENVLRTPWKEQISLIHKSFQQHAKDCTHKYDFVISNPPFFEKSLKSSDRQRNLARHNDSLPFEDLITGVKKILSENGRFCIILPYVDAQVFIVDAAFHHLYCNEKTTIKPARQKKATRVLMEFSTVRTKIEEHELYILDTENQFSEGYMNLTKDYYLNF